MKLEINKNEFKVLYKASGYTDFSDYALEIIFSYFEEQGEITTFDPVCYRCNWTEYEREDLINDFDYCLEEEDEEKEDDDEKLEKLIEVLNEKTFIKELKNGNYLVEIF